MARGDGLMERLQWWLLLLSAVMFSMSGCGSTKAWQGTALSDWQVWAQHSSHFASGQHLAFSLKSHPTPASISEGDKATASREEWWGQLVPQEKVAVVAKTKAKPKPSTPPAAIASSSEPAPDSSRAAAPARATTAAKESWWRRMLPGGKKTTPAVATASTAVVPSASAPAPIAPIDRKDISGVWRGRWAANGSWGERRESEAHMIFAQQGTKGTARMVLTDTVAATGVPEVVRHFGALGTPMNIRVSRSEVVARFEDGPAVLVRFKRDGDRLYGRIDASPSFVLVLERQ
jgi:hypothetical protein